MAAEIRVPLAPTTHKSVAWGGPAKWSFKAYEEALRLATQTTSGLDDVRAALNAGRPISLAAEFHCPSRSATKVDLDTLLTDIWHPILEGLCGPRPAELPLPSKKDVLIHRAQAAKFASDTHGVSIVIAPMSSIDPDADHPMAAHLASGPSVSAVVPLAPVTLRDVWYHQVPRSEFKLYEASVQREFASHPSRDELRAWIASGVKLSLAIRYHCTYARLQRLDLDSLVSEIFNPIVVGIADLTPTGRPTPQWRDARFWKLDAAKIIGDREEVRITISRLAPAT